MGPLFYKLHVLIVITGSLIIAGLLLVYFLESASGALNMQGGGTVSPTDSLATNISENLKAASRSLGSVPEKVGQTARSTKHTLSSAFGSVPSTTARIGRSAVQSVQSGTNFAFHSVCSLAVGVLQIPGNILESVEKTGVAGAVIRPADSEKAPTIQPHTLTLLPVSTATPDSAALPAAPPSVASPATPPPPPVPDVEAAWPIHGAITTLFGASDLPFERIHTGLDISDGRPSGVTPVHPFKQGRVVEAVHSYLGLGNHVIVDNGGGMTSVYGHLAYISVQVGQGVDEGNTLGYEGSTGASTGTHLHFEIRINGRPVNPLLYIDGRP